MTVAPETVMAIENERGITGCDPEVGTMPAPIPLDERVREYEASLIRWALQATHGNKSRAARLLQVKRSTLGDRIARCGLNEHHEVAQEQAAV
jgi:DNA-binding NtrC family response regulator